MSNITRRDVIQASATAGLAGAALAHSAIAAPTRRPNIIFILADDMGYADISCNGRTGISTPNIDRIAASGVNLRQAYANSAVCSASRTALITGRYQYRLPIGLEEPLAGADVGLPPDIPTLPSQLNAAGYHTMLIGKWHLGELPKYGPLKSGYEHFFGFRGGALDYFNHLTTSGKKDLWTDDVPTDQAGYLTELIGAHAVRAVEEYASRPAPFFLSVHFNAPHWPWETAQGETESRRLKAAGLVSDGGLREPGLRDWDGGSRAIYESMVNTMDKQIGQILDALTRTKLLDDTIIVFTSDNGGERFSDTWPFSGQKTELLEGGIRVPALISWPGRLPKGVVNQQVCATMDWLPTLLSAAGIAPAASAPSDGIDLMPLLRPGATPQSRTLYWRYKANHQRAVRDGDYKFLQISDHNYLFNVVVDPLERADLKLREPDVFVRLQTKWKEWNATMLPEKDATFTEGVRAEFQADHIGAEHTIKTADPGN